ncbi:MAG: hypothetical protein GQ561_01710 [Calditrichae bacterium]|nr:hypothetical protein [Calditrichia bacterium]
MAKINQLIKEWPKGTVMTLDYLKQNGINRNLIKRYRRSGWIDNVGRAAYRLAGDNLELAGGLYAVQNQLKLKIHVGARTALELKGYGHYLGPGIRRVFMFGQPGEYLPVWFKKYDWPVDYYYTTTNLFPDNLPSSFTESKYKDINITISTAERAVLEMLHLIPEQQGFDEALQIMKSLTTLRPELLQKLLENCRSIKVKRLFLYMSESEDHVWFSDLIPDRINLGSGKRVVIKNGYLDKKYNITVPRLSEN